MTENKENFSYSKLSLLDKCPYAFKLKYEDKNFSNASSLALEIGTIAHKCKELIALDLIMGRAPDYELITQVLYQGFDNTSEETDNKDHGVKHIPGVNELKSKYVFDWIKPDNKSGMTYDQKIELFVSNLHDMEDDPIWRPLAVEVPFSFEFAGQNIVGYIDKLDVNAAGEIRVVDYKTSKAIFSEADVKTAMQMVIYDLAVQKLYGKVPVEHLYDFIFIGKKQHACTKGYLKRGEAKLNKWFALLADSRDKKEFPPKPTPLCHWCDFCATNCDADPILKYKCEYYSLWTPSNKTFAVAQEYTAPKRVSQDFWF